MPAPTARIRVGIDVGGTFTDAVMVRGGRLRMTKARTTPADFSRGFIDALEALPGVSAADVDYLVHGSTVATNAIVQGRTARVGLLTTAGFADTLPIGTQQRAALYDLHRPRPGPLVPAACGSRRASASHPTERSSSPWTRTTSPAQRGASPARASRRWPCASCSRS